MEASAPHPMGVGSSPCAKLTVRGVRDPRHCLVALGTRADNVGESIVAEGHGFYGAPRVNDAGDRLVTVVWDHPDMPWDSSAVVVIPLEVVVDEAADDLAGRPPPVRSGRWPGPRTSRWVNQPGGSMGACALSRIGRAGGSPGSIRVRPVRIRPNR